MNKKMFFVSNGRCGTTRIQEILNSHLDDSFTVVHQMKYSRIGNIIGNIFYIFGSNKKIKEKIFDSIINKYDTKINFISTDSLSAMLIPQKYINSNKVAIVHIVRASNDFADSFIRFSKSRLKSIIAHNIIPFWQIGIYPFERMWNKNIKQKYIKLNDVKNKWFEKNYSKNQNYVKINMQQIFTNDNLENIVNKFFSTDIKISEEELKTKSNETN